MRLTLSGIALLCVPGVSLGMSPMMITEDHTARFRVEKVDYDGSSDWTICVYRPAPRADYKPGFLAVTLQRSGADVLRVALANARTQEGCDSFSFTVSTAASKDYRLWILDVGAEYSGNFEFYDGPIDDIPVWTPPMKFLGYDPALGKDLSTDGKQARFAGEIEISGFLDVERDQRPACKGACAYFAPDSDEDKRLPRVPIEGISDGLPVGRIELGEARAVLERSLPPSEVARVLANTKQTYYARARLRLRGLHIADECHGYRYQAQVVHLQVETRAAATFDPEPDEESLPEPDC